MTDDNLKTALQDRYAGFVTRNESCCGPRSGCGCAGDASLALGYGPGDLEAVPEGANLGLGCGNPVALASLEPGQVVLDLGSGAGFDAFLASRKVGPEGRVIGVDMTPAMLERARGLAARNGYANVEFREGDIEALPVEDASVDVVISNCVINLAQDKAQAFREAYRALKPGGSLMVSDLVLEGPLPAELARDLDAYAACVGGALPKEEYLGAIRGAGFQGVEVMGESAFDLGDPGLMEVAGDLTGGRIPAPDLLAASRCVASVQVRATKPREGKGCCGPGCCA